MTDFVRIPGKIFAENASPVGNNPEIGKFGNAKQGIYTGEADVREIQNSEAWLQGWTEAVVSAMNYPPLPEMNGVLKVLSYQICYLLQKGIPEWNADTVYYKNDYVNYNGKLYYSDIDNNTFEPETPGAGNSWLSGTSDVAIATLETNGISRPDGETLKINEDGILSVNKINELNTPFTLFDSKYSETPLYNASWLLSNRSFYSKSIYITAYEALVVEQNKEIQIGSVEQLPSGTNYIKRGLSVKLSTDDFTDYDFVLNKDEETFRLPLLNGEESISGTSNIPVTVSLSGTQYTAPSNGIITAVFSALTYGGWIQFENLTNQEVSVIRICESGSNWVFSNNMFAKRGDIINITYDGVLTANYNFYPYVGNGNLYYYIGESVQNINLLDVGTVLEQLNSSKRGYLVESYSEEKAGYRVYSDGYCEQWGYTPSVSVGATYTVNLYKNYKDSNYNISYSELAPVNTQGGYAQSNNMCITPVNSNTFILWSGNTNPIYFYWKTSGWLA